MACSMEEAQCTHKCVATCMNVYNGRNNKQSNLMLQNEKQQQQQQQKTTLPEQFVYAVTAIPPSELPPGCEIIKF